LPSYTKFVTFCPSYAFGISCHILLKLCQTYRLLSYYDNLKKFAQLMSNLPNYAKLINFCPTYVKFTK
jgi:uncharacterized membrane protein